MEVTFELCEEKDFDFMFELKMRTMKWYIEKIYGWDEHVQRDKAIGEIRKYAGGMRIILVDGKRAGITTFTEENGEYLVGLLMVAPEYQNRGIATSILKEYIEKAKSENKRITIRTYVENPAQYLYQRLGFKIYDKSETHLFMEIK